MTRLHAPVPDPHDAERSLSLPTRPRRNRRTDALRRMVRENAVRPDDLIWPLFVTAGSNVREPIAAMPGCARMSPDVVVEEVAAAASLGIPAVALFPALPDTLKDPRASESIRGGGLLQTTVKSLKDAVPEMMVITDVAMDPYSSDGHDGVVEDGLILNDATLTILGDMAVSQAEAGADVVAPSDMMDGRVGYIRARLDAAGYTDVGILSYAVKYASGFYGPFREALDSAPRSGDKKTYQMDPANSREALREIALDAAEGADMVMVKPGMPYLDVIASVRSATTLPVAAYQVSGEYAMLKAAAAQGWLDESTVMLESLLSFKRAGADVILTYFAVDAARLIG